MAEKRDPHAKAQAAVQKANQATKVKVDNITLAEKKTTTLADPNDGGSGQLKRPPSGPSPR